MTEIVPAVPVSADDQAVFEVMRTDAVLTGRAMFVAGLLVAAEADTAGSPEKLPADMWPDVDPALVSEIWGRACVVAWRASQYAGSPRLHGDRLHVLQAQLTEAGHVAMGGSVGRSRELAVGSGHPADGEIAREREG